MNVEQFIHAYIETVDQLRAVLLLASDRQVEWSETDVGAKLYLLPASARAVLDRLVAKGLCVGQGEPRRYRYQPQSPEMAQFVQEVVELDRERPVTLLKIVYARPKDIQAFADAFRLRKEKGD
ncbi:MAG: hypothetical protein ACYC6N_25635 [Pirellulaceae bacterium]